jgi:hypothetical protein
VVVVVVVVVELDVVVVSSACANGGATEAMHVATRATTAAWRTPLRWWRARPGARDGVAAVGCMAMVVSARALTGSSAISRH